MSRVGTMRTGRGTGTVEGRVRVAKNEGIESWIESMEMRTDVSRNLAAVHADVVRAEGNGIVTAMETTRSGAVIGVLASRMTSHRRRGRIMMTAEVTVITVTAVAIDRTGVRRTTARMRNAIERVGGGPLDHPLGQSTSRRGIIETEKIHEIARIMIAADPMTMTKGVLPT